MPAGTSTARNCNLHEPEVLVRSYPKPLRRLVPVSHNCPVIPAVIFRLGRHDFQFSVSWSESRRSELRGCLGLAARNEDNSAQGNSPLISEHTATIAEKKSLIMELDVGVRAREDPGRKGHA